MDHESYNRVAARVLIVEEENKSLRRLIINSFRLICKVGLAAEVLTDDAVRKALAGVEE